MKRNSSSSSSSSAGSGDGGVMVNRWRRRRMCILMADGPAPAAIREVSARGAFLETNARPPIGTRICLSHPEAGAIGAEVRTLGADGIGVAFPLEESSVAFALAAIGADMTQPR